MTLQEQLTLLRESILNDRTDRTSGSSDYLWTDTTLTTFINEAQRKFAVESLILRDGTGPATVVTMASGQDTYDLDPSVIAVLSVGSPNTSVGLQRLGHSFFSGFRPTNEMPLDPATFANAQPAMPVAYSTDEALYVDNAGLAGVTMKVYPVPSGAQDGVNLRLRVVRKPAKLVNLDDVCELPEDHHIELLDWAAYLALRIVDDDAGAPARAQEFAGSFMQHVTDAKKLAMRKLFAPAGWGFGRGGFTWSN